MLLNVAKKPASNTAEQHSDLPEEKKSKTGRNRGRPRGRNDPSIDWDAVENAYVWGETIRQREDGSYVRAYPTFKQLGEKFKVAPSLVHYYAKKQKWLDRRLSVIKQTREEFDALRSKSAARKTVNALEVLEAWLVKFAKNVEEEKVRADSIQDLDKVVRLMAFIEGKGDSRVEHRVTITLEALQQRHAVIRARVIEADGAVAGEIKPGEDERLLSGMEAEEEQGDQDAHEEEADEHG